MKIIYKEDEDKVYDKLIKLNAKKRIQEVYLDWNEYHQALESAIRHKTCCTGNITDRFILHAGTDFKVYLKEAWGTGRSYV